MLGYILFRTFLKFNACCSLSKAARMLSTYLRYISDVYYYKWPYIGKCSDHVKMKLSKLCK